MLKSFLWGAVATLVCLPLTESRAHACGGCFRPPQQTISVVNAHRMVLSVSQQQTVLWDQFSYSGNPQDFAWVLPVHAASVEVELAHDEFVSALDAWTAPVIIGPVQKSSSGFGCNASSSASYSGGTTPGVQVISQQTVGPYDVATLAATDPNALENWLSQNGYDIPSSIQPTIAAYVAGGFDFIALRLQPGEGVASMQPVRVVTSGADASLPLRMVAAGVGSDVSILLYVISEGRYEAANFNNTTVDFSQLDWNKTTNASNYDSLVNTAMTSGDGRNFTVEFAGHLFANDPTTTPRSNFTTTYLQGAAQAKNCAYAQIHGPDFASQEQPGFGDGGDDASDLDATTEASVTDAGASDDDGGTLATPYDACLFDDLTVATTGMNTADVFVTRLRADLKVSALDQDLVVQAASDQSPYDNVHTTTQSGDGCATSSSAPDRGMILFAFGMIAALFAWKRRAR